jgi:hypothetical protein
MSYGTTQPSEIVCEMDVAQLLQTLSSLTAKHINSSVVGWSFSKLVLPSGGTKQQQSFGSFETKLLSFHIDWCGYGHFSESVKFLCRCQDE